MRALDATHDPALESWVGSANAPDTDFPVQNLPFGIFRARGEGPHRWRGGVAIGDAVLDLNVLRESAAGRALADDAALLALGAACGPELNALMSLGVEHAVALRRLLSRVLERGSGLKAALRGAVLPQSGIEHRLPARIGDYTDFYASIHHATAVGRLMRPDNPLLPNYRWVPIGYHGRASSIGVSGQVVARPRGQVLPKGASVPQLAPSGRMDYELEVGIYVGAGNAPGRAIAAGEAEAHVFGLGLLNDWSARDIQAWEYQPLGPFLAKNFATTISPWIVTLEALAPFRCPWTRAAADPQPLAYLDAPALRAAGGVDLELEVLIETAQMRAQGRPPQRLSRSNFRESYWCLAQLVAHHTVNGCNLEPGDLLGSGTQSGPEPAQAGSLLELTAGGTRPLELASGESRRFLEDGDRVILRGWCERPGARRIGFGTASGKLEAALPG